MNGIVAYKDHAVTTQSQGKLIVLLYDGAIKFLTQAAELIESGDAAGKGNAIGRAMDIITELEKALDLESGGEVAENLARLYDFMHRHLFQANLKQDANMVREVIAMLEELNESWRAIAG